MLKVGLTVFALLGGVGFVFKMLQKEAGAAVDLGIEALEKNPAVKAWILAHRTDIEALFDAVDAELKKKLEADAASGTQS